ncbi:MAG: AIM24 family protein, partial [Candidatus Kapabacteria bacterium]|nr:AIM24 family protein [Candidatus Kapabacteria bacterium]
IVNGNDVLAFDDTITYDITMMRKISGMMSGGLFNIKLKGTGYAAITTHGKPLVLKVTPDSPVITDPNATVAWSTNLKTDIKTDISFGTFFGRGSGESIQQVFTGNGFVVVQPFEEVYYDASNA